MFCRSILAAMVCAFGVCAQTAVANEASAWTAARSTITTAESRRHVDTLASDAFEGREAGQRGGRAAAVYLMKELSAAGLKAGNRGSYFQDFSGNSRNVLAWIEGSDPERKHEVIVIGAHYDHVGYGSRRNSRGTLGRVHNGADDNASGTAAVLELAEAIASLPQSPSRSILFAFWDGEEKGLLGSKHWVAKPTVDLKNIVAAINLDMVGRVRESRLEVLGSRTAPGLREMVSRQNRDDLKLDFQWQIKENSDHFNFFNQKIPVLMFHSGLHEDYHTPRDDAHLINSHGVALVSQLVFDVVRELAEGDNFRFRQASRYETVVDRNKFSRAIAGKPARLGISWHDETSDGLLIRRVNRGSPAEAAGMLAGDRLIRFAGETIDSDHRMRELVLRASDTVEVEVLRRGEKEPRKLSVKLRGKPTRVGFAWRVNSAEPHAVTLVQVIPDTPAGKSDLQVGDRIYEVNGRRFASSDQFMKLVTTQAMPLELLVESQGRLRIAELESIRPPQVAQKPVKLPELVTKSGE